MCMHYIHTKTYIIYIYTYVYVYIYIEWTRSVNHIHNICIIFPCIYIYIHVCTYGYIYIPIICCLYTHVRSTGIVHRITNICYCFIAIFPCENSRKCKGPTQRFQGHPNIIYYCIQYFQTVPSLFLIYIYIYIRIYNICLDIYINTFTLIQHHPKR